MAALIELNHNSPNEAIRMSNEIFDLKVEPAQGYDEELLTQHLIDLGKISSQKDPFKIMNRSIDARSKKVWVNLRIALGENVLHIIDKIEYKNVSNAPKILIVGAGPAGLFAALRAVELGFKPIVIERGSDVRKRRRDLAAINKSHTVNPESNYCFGEGGAGTYSDGKLYTRSNKRGDIKRILEIFVQHGANPEILVDAHPHIGTNKLPALVANLRNTILEHGGEVHFDTKVTDFIIQDNSFKGVVTHKGEEILGQATILATGHSARDIFRLCQLKGVLIEAKPFALGVRVEHPQHLIDKIQYHCDDRGPYLPASSYSLVTQAKYKGEERGVFSFCMCPGGFIVPAATETGEVVVNGMSPSRRDSKYANSGIVVAIEAPDWQKHNSFQELAAMELQAEIEKKACILAGNNQTAPAQRLSDFVERKTSSSLNPCSYQPGLHSISMDEVLPPFISERLRYGFTEFGKKMRGYLSNEAQIVGVESRTSSPVRIPRDKESCEHLTTKNLYPCGEGAGYAGGIMSAAMDGERCVNMAVKKLVGG